MIAGGPAGLHAVSGDDFLFADRAGLQPLQMFGAEHARPCAFDKIATEGDASGEETHQVPRFLAGGENAPASLSARSFR